MKAIITKFYIKGYYKNINVGVFVLSKAITEADYTEITGEVFDGNVVRAYLGIPLIEVPVEPEPEV